MSTRPALLSLAVLLLIGTAPAQQFITFVDPILVKSPSGQWSLRVDPNLPYGQGPATYILMHEGEPDRILKLDCTLCDVQLGDDGAFAGTSQYGFDPVRLMLVGPDGKARFDETLEVEARPVDCPTEPFSRGVLPMPDEDSVAFGLRHSETPERRSEDWRVVRWSTGEVLPTLVSPPPGWAVYASQRNARPARPASPPPMPLPLELLGTIEPRVAPKVQGFGDFDIDDRGRLAHVLGGPEAPLRFELLDDSGTRVVDLPLPIDVPPHSHVWPVWILGDRWLLLQNAWDAPVHASAWWLDLSGGVLTPIADFRSGAIDAADGTLDGGFVAVCQHDETLSSFGPDGQLRWRDTGNVNRKPGLVSPEDVCIGPRGEVGVIDVVRRQIQRFDAKGNWLDAIELDAVASRRLNYPSGLSVDGAGTWVVYDFEGSPSGLRISREGKLLSGFTPHFPDGRRLEPRGGLHAAPDGNVWVTDGFALLRLDASGAVDRILGAPPDASVLGAVQFSFVAPDGRIALADARTDAVHLFDATGAPLAVCKPRPQDVSGLTEVTGISISDEGRIHVGLRHSFESQSWAIFGRTGEWIGTEDGGGIPGIGIRCFQPGTGRRWQTSMNALDLTAGDGSVVVHLARSADDRWLNIGTGGCSVAPDGSFAMVSRDRLHIFGPTGKAVASLDLPEGAKYARLAFDGAHVVFVYDTTVWAVDVATHAVRKANVPALTRDRVSRPFWRADVKELWIVDEAARKVLRFRLGE
jgi:hypothetical protein